MLKEYRESQQLFHNHTFQFDWNIIICMYNNPCPIPQMLWRTLWAGCWQNAFLLNVDSMPSHQDISHSLSIPGHNQDSHDDHLYGGADQASEDRRGGPPANHKSSFVISYVISWLPWCPRFSQGCSAHQASADGRGGPRWVVLQINTSRRLPPQDCRQHRRHSHSKQIW